MKNFNNATYGQKIAAIYDSLYSNLKNDEIIEFLNEYSNTNPVLELGIGTGRIALPLQNMGHKIYGIDSSESMINKLKEKPRGKEIQTELTDFENFNLNIKFSLVYVVFNTFFGILTQKGQVNCFKCVSKHLKSDGAFILETFVPDLSRFDRDQRTSVTHIELNKILTEYNIHNRNNQNVICQYHLITESKNQLFPLKIRYAYPSELDLMANLAGLKLTERYSNWKKEMFTNSSNSHISVYRKK